MVKRIKIGIVDYGVSNLTSVFNAFGCLGADVLIVKDAIEIDKCSHLVLPGVGSFSAGMKGLELSGMIPLIQKWVDDGKPLIGMCLGMQLLAEVGTEFETVKGLGFLSGTVDKMYFDDNEFRLPHIGWNEVIRHRDSVLLREIPDPAVFYFVHSYAYVDIDKDYVLGVSDYGGGRVSIVEKDNVFGTQFHPEKSQKHGLQLLKNFIDIN